MDAQDASELLDGSWLSTEELAGILGVDPSTLRRWRTVHPLQGPPFICLSTGLTRYSAGDVGRWLASRRVDPGQVA